MKDDRFYLRHIQDCIANIQEYVAGGEEAFLASTLIQDAVIRKLQVMAESTIRLSEALKTPHPEVAWRDIRGFRNVVVHDYTDVDLEVVWHIIQNDLPPLKTAVDAMLESLSADE